MPLRNIKGLVEYDGTAFEGFQVQPEGHRTVQGEIKRVLENILNHPVTVKGASRTDAGVHATGQVVSFKTSASRTLQEIISGVRSQADPDWTIRQLAKTGWDFNPRYDAKAKTYCYILDLAGSILRNRYSWEIREKLDIGEMRERSALFIGEHDFKSFTTSGAHRDDVTIRRIDDVTIDEYGDLVAIRITGSGFLYQMVRRMVYALVQSAKGEISKEDFLKLINEPDFDKTEKAAPSNGLILEKILF
jgi:tRNA pseudouridine38-40 synthase